MTDRKKNRTGEISASPVETPMLEGFPLPEGIVVSEILRRLDIESLFTAACVCRALRSTIPGALSSLDLSGFSVYGELLDHIIPRLKEVKRLTIDCLRLDSSDILRILEPCIQELSLLKCVSLSYDDLPLIGERCPNLRVLVLELGGDSSPETLRKNLIEMLKRLSYLENLSIIIRGTESDECPLSEIDLFLPRSVKFLRLHLVTEQHAVQFIEKLRHETDIAGAPLNIGFIGTNLLRLSIVLDVISDRLMLTITVSLPFLAELHLQDTPRSELKMPHDLTNNGLHHLRSCRHLRHLSIVRSRQYRSFSFKRVNDIGFLLLSQSCGGLESVKLGGFSKVTDAGFSSLLRSCPNLNKFEVLEAPLLSNMAFDGAVKCPLVELKLKYCNLITSEAIAKLASSSISLQVLDTYGCRSVADSSCLGSSLLSTLTSLNLGASDITDDGLFILGKANLPLTNLCLRECVRISDRGISYLFNGPRRINKTLSSLDLGCIPGISNRSIRFVVSNAEAILELCIRDCRFLTDIALMTLASGRNGKSCLIRNLDVSYCHFSSSMVDLLRRPPSHSFRGLKWLGVRGTSLAKVGNFGSFFPARPWLTVCSYGCGIGCCNGWYAHKDEEDDTDSDRDIDIDIDIDIDSDSDSDTDDD